MARPAVRHTVDFNRVANLPRRRLDPVDAKAWAHVLTPLLVADGSGESLRPWQAMSLVEIAEHPCGAVLGLPVGIGKTLIAYLSEAVCKAERPIMIMAATLVDKTWDDFGKLATQWKQPRNPFNILTRESLALEPNHGLLESIQPDLIYLEEADEFANWESAACQVIDRYVMSARAAGRTIKVIAGTGTLVRKSIMAMWHIFRWCLGEDGSPMPKDRYEAQRWSQALDEQTREPINRPSPGPLGPNRREALRWYHDRVLETPGIVIIDEDSCNAALTIRTRLAREDEVLDQVYKDFSKYSKTPGGLYVTDPLSRWTLDAFLGCGLYNRYVEQPPEEWREANRAKSKFVRDRIYQTRHARRPMLTEGQVLRHHASHPIVEAWREIKDTFDPVTETIWFSRSTIDSVEDWLEELDLPGQGIIWTGSVDFGQALANESGLEYYGAGGQCAAGHGLHEAPPGKSFVASWNANKRGFNLQAWPRQLWIHPPQSAKWLEQGFGRSHRSGQMVDVVIDILLTSGGTIDAFEAAVREARFAKSSHALTQKILRANIVRATPKITPSNRFRWASRSDRD